jgi:hypothetical protein
LRRRDGIFERDVCLQLRIERAGEVAGLRRKPFALRGIK